MKVLPLRCHRLDLRVARMTALSGATRLQGESILVVRALFKNLSIVYKILTFLFSSR